MTPLIAKGRVNWFSLGKKFGFVELESGMGDAFLHVSVLKEAGYVFVPAGTTLRVRVEPERGRQRIVAVLSVDTSTAWPGEPPPVVRKAAARPDGAGDRGQPHETPFRHIAREVR
jgi:cold shock protein